MNSLISTDSGVSQGEPLGGGGLSVSGNEWDSMVSVGRIARSHGNTGNVIVDPSSDFIEERFRVGNAVYVHHGDRIKPLMIANVRFHRGRPIVGFVQVQTMAAAQELASFELRVPIQALDHLPDGMFYHHELSQCQVVTTAGRIVGKVVGLEDGGGACRLIIDGGSSEIQVPLVASICKRIEPGVGIIEIDPPDGLLELNLRSRDGQQKSSVGR